MLNPVSQLSYAQVVVKNSPLKVCEHLNSFLSNSVCFKIRYKIAEYWMLFCQKKNLSLQKKELRALRFLVENQKLDFVKKLSLENTPSKLLLDFTNKKMNSLKRRFHEPKMDLSSGDFFKKKVVTNDEINNFHLIPQGRLNFILTLFTDLIFPDDEVSLEGIDLCLSHLSNHEVAAYLCPRHREQIVEVLTEIQSSFTIQTFFSKSKKVDDNLSFFIELDLKLPRPSKITTQHINRALLKAALHSFKQENCVGNCYAVACASTVLHVDLYKFFVEMYAILRNGHISIGDLKFNPFYVVTTNIQLNSFDFSYSSPVQNFPVFEEIRAVYSSFLKDDQPVVKDKKLCWYLHAYHFSFCQKAFILMCELACRRAPKDYFNNFHHSFGKIFEETAKRALSKKAVNSYLSFLKQRFFCVSGSVESLPFRQHTLFNKDDKTELSSIHTLYVIKRKTHADVCYELDATTPKRLLSITDIQQAFEEVTQEFLATPLAFNLSEVENTYLTDYPSGVALRRDIEMCCINEADNSNRSLSELCLFNSVGSLGIYGLRYFFPSHRVVNCDFHTLPDPKNEKKYVASLTLPGHICIPTLLDRQNLETIEKISTIDFKNSYGAMQTLSKEKKVSVTIIKSLVNELKDSNGDLLSSSIQKKLLERIQSVSFRRYSTYRAAIKIAKEINRNGEVYTSEFCIEKQIREKLGYPPILPIAVGNWGDRGSSEEKWRYYNLGVLVLNESAHLIKRKKYADQYFHPLDQMKLVVIEKA